MADERETFFGDPSSVPRRGTKEEGPLAPFPKAPRHETEGAGKAVSPELGPKARAALHGAFAPASAVSGFAAEVLGVVGGEGGQVVKWFPCGGRCAAQIGTDAMV